MSKNIPCPSCGNADVKEFIPLPEKYPSFDAIICRECGMRGPTAAWNSRAPSPDLVEAWGAISTLRDIVRGFIACKSQGNRAYELFVARGEDAVKETEKFGTLFTLKQSSATVDKPFA